MKKYSQNQYDINLEIDAIRVLALILSFGECRTRDNIANLVNMSEFRLSMALSFLKGNDYITTYKSYYLATDCGREYYEATKRKPQFDVSPHRWKFEVLTGLDYYGQRTKINNPAIPNTKKHEFAIKTPEEIIVDSDSKLKTKKYIAAGLGLTIKEFDEKLLEGRIRVCKGYNRDKHIGIFDRKGEYWRSLCKQCRSKKRKGKS